MNTISADPIRLPLDKLHESLGAKMVSFAGFRMPVQYAGLKQEHLHTREFAGLFDVSHMGQLRVTAKDGEQSSLFHQLEAALPVDFDGWSDDLQRYSLLLNETGGVEDDLMVTRLPGEVRIVVNAGNREADLALFQALCPELNFDWVDAALIALQGPQAEAVLALLDEQAAQMTFMQTRELDLDGAKCLTSRSGYTGEDGYEISIPSADAERIVRKLLATDGVQAIGLGARDSLRLEAGLPLHGNDISADTTPIEAGLIFGIAKSRRNGGKKAGGFPGAEKILKQLADGPTRRLVGLVSAENIPVRAGASIYNPQEQVVGEVTSGTISPSLNQPVMLAYLDSNAINAASAAQSDGGGLVASVRNKRPGVHITPLPFVPKRYKR